MSLLAYSLITIIRRIVWLVNILILIRVLLSWINFSNSFANLIYSITEPLLKPFRDILDKYVNLPIDLSPLLLIIFIEFMEKILMRLIVFIFY